MLDELVRSAREGIEVPWDDLREERVLRRTLATDPPAQSAAQRRPIRRWLGFTAAVSAAGVALLVAAPWRDTTSTMAQTERATANEEVLRPAPPLDASPDESRLLLSDGSVVMMGPGAEVAVSVDGAERVALRQDAGEADYAILPRPGRAFSLAAGAVVIEAEVAAFSVSVDGEITAIVVDAGRVELRSGDRVLTFGAGERATLRPSPTDVVAEDPDAVALPEPGRGSGRASTRSRPPSGPRPEEIDERPPSPHPSAEELMRMADEARRARKPGEAASLLRRLVERYPGDARVPSAWFTLGRVERARGRQRAAAEAFEACTRSRPEGPLAGDALARAATAWMAAERRDRGVELARRYLERFPGGLHAASMHEIIR